MQTIKLNCDVKKTHIQDGTVFDLKKGIGINQINNCIKGDSFF